VIRKKRRDAKLWVRWCGLAKGALQRASACSVFCYAGQRLPRAHGYAASRRGGSPRDR
jgi:hypothetical protein